MWTILKEEKKDEVKNLVVISHLFMTQSSFIVILSCFMPRFGNFWLVEKLFDPYLSQVPSSPFEIISISAAPFVFSKNYLDPLLR